MDILILFIASALALYMAWTIGANDVANAMGTSVGSGTLTVKKAILIAAVFEFLGAVLVGAWVSNTMKSEIIAPSAFPGPEIFIAGMVASLLAAAIWVTIATYYGLPVSTSHAVVGALMGFGLLAIFSGIIGYGDVGFGKIGEIALSWLVSPFAAGGMAFVIFTYIKHSVSYSDDPISAANRNIPMFVGLVVFILLLSIFYNMASTFGYKLSTTFIFINSAELALFSFALSKRQLSCKHFDCPGDEMAVVEKMFGFLLIITCSYVAFAHGANNVANAVGPVMAIIEASEGATHSWVYYFLLSIGGIGLVFGITTWGHKVMETIGRKITEITPTSGFAATFATATVTLACTRLGYPTSVSQVMVGAIVGVGFAGGIRALDFKLIRNIVVSWVITVPISAGLAALLFMIFREMV
jgi:PiT family inorganic phosphate transporter